jgi:RNA polymerase sigma-70 factor (ECF subfamily)
MLRVNKQTQCLTQDDLFPLMARIQNADRTAFAQFYDATVTKVFSSAMRITRNRADAEEVTCEVYRCVWRVAKRYNPSRGNPAQWLMVITRNRSLDCFRQRRRVLRAVREPCNWHVAGVAAIPEELLHRLEMTSLVGRELARLPVQQALILQLAFFDELSHSEIAEKMKLPLGTVKSSIARALLKLRAALQIRELAAHFKTNSRSRDESTIASDLGGFANLGLLKGPAYAFSAI